MKYIVFLICALFLVSCAGHPVADKVDFSPSGSGTLMIDITGFHNDDGEVLVSVFNDKKGFPNDTGAAYLNLTATITDHAARFEIPDLPYGAYAVSVLHDENRDGRMNSNVVGIPKEGFGLSLNPRLKRKQPEYEDARFLLLVEQKEMVIEMQYETFGRDRQRIMQERREQKSKEQ